MQVCGLLGQLWPDSEVDTPQMRQSFECGLQSPGQKYICAVQDEKVVGFCSLNIKNSLWQQGLMAHVDELVVDQRHRGVGIGSALLRRVEEIAAEMGCKRVELDSAHHRIQAHTFYEGLGFENRALLFSKTMVPGGNNLPKCSTSERKSNGLVDTVIREVRPDDAEAVISILNPIIESAMYSALDTKYTVEAEVEFIRNFPPRGVFHIAEDPREHKAVGFQTLEPFADYTQAFDHVGVIATFTDLGWRRRGIGRRLSEVTFESGRGKGYEKIFTFVRADNPEALQFYLKLGFHVIGTAQKHTRIGGNYMDEIIIEKFL